MKTLAQILCVMLIATGCASSRHIAANPAAELTSPTANRDVEAYVTPPIGWTAEPIKGSKKHRHQVWLSPSHNTAYGIIRFSLPLPVGEDLALWGFLNEMRRTEGEANLVSKNWDKNLGGLRFVADGGLYRVRVNMFLDGFHGWAVYAGTLRHQPLMEEELAVAEQAREHTAVGLREADRR